MNPPDHHHMQIIGAFRWIFETLGAIKVNRFQVSVFRIVFLFCLIFDPAPYALRLHYTQQSRMTEGNVLYDTGMLDQRFSIEFIHFFIL